MLHADGARVTAGQFTYQAVLEHDITGSALGSRTVTATQTSYNGANAWLFLDTKTGASVGSVDSLFVEQGSLRPLHWSSTIGRARLGLGVSLR